MEGSRSIAVIAEHTAQDLSRRSAREVFEEHLDLRLRGLVDLDIERNYAPDVVLLTSFGVWHGHEGVRHGARLLCSQIGDAEFEYVTRCVHRDVAFLEWKVKSDRVNIEDGADTFIIRNGRIVVKTIHYTVRDGGPPLA